MYFFEYCVKIYNSDTDEMEKYCGITCAKDYPTAASLVIEFYNGVEEITLSQWDCEDCLQISSEVMDDLREDVAY